MARAAELAHADLERHARARRVLLEDHRQRVAIERRVVVGRGLRPARRARACARALRRGSRAASALESGADDRGSDASSRSRARFAPFAAASTASIASISLADVRASSMISGGARRSTLSPATPTSTLRSRSLAWIALGIDLQLEAAQQALAAHFDDQFGMAILQAFQRLAEIVRDLVARAPGTPASRFRRSTHCRPPSPADCRRTCVPCTPLTMPLAASRVARNAPIGKPPPTPLATAITSGVDARPFVRPQLAGAARAALHFVEDERKPFSSESLRRAVRYSSGRGAHAAFALHRLDQDQPAVVGPTQRLQRVEIAERRLHDSPAGAGRSLRDRLDCPRR